MMRSLGLRKGEVVEVRGLDEIVSTLDGQGKMDGLAFMPEMGRLCGQRFRVHARADRTCVEHMGKRGLHDTVWLKDVRCDGSAHDGCQIACLMFWKEAWLKRVEASAAAAAPGPAEPISSWPFPIRMRRQASILVSSQPRRSHQEPSTSGSRETASPTPGISPAAT
jgi:hypothetical protein